MAGAPCAGAFKSPTAIVFALAENTKIDGVLLSLNTIVAVVDAIFSALVGVRSTVL